MGKFLDIQYGCMDCGHLVDDAHMNKASSPFVCPKCKGSIRARNGSKFHYFKPMIYNDICETPILIESKQHLAKECRKHGVMAARLM